MERTEALVCAVVLATAVVWFLRWRAARILRCNESLRSFIVARRCKSQELRASTPLRPWLKKMLRSRGYTENKDGTINQQHLLLQEDLEAAIEKVMTNNGYTRRGNTWVKEGDGDE